MSHISVGVYGVRTKAELKRRAKVEPDKVECYSTSALGGTYNGTLFGIPENLTLTVVGPDPYTDRRWYASVTRKGDVVKVT